MQVGAVEGHGIDAQGDFKANMNCNSLETYLMCCFDSLNCSA